MGWPDACGHRVLPKERDVVHQRGKCPKSTMSYINTVNAQGADPAQTCQDRYFSSDVY